MTENMPEAQPVKGAIGYFKISRGVETVIPGTDWVVWAEDPAFVSIMDDGAVEISGSTLVYVRKLGMWAPT